MDDGTSRTLSPDRIVRALIALVDDLTVEQDEEGLVHSTLEHLVDALGISGGRLFLVDDEQELAAAADCGLRLVEGAKLHSMACQALEEDCAAVHDLEGGGWVATAPLRARQHTLGVLTLHDPGGDGLAPSVELLDVVGKQIGTGLENTRHYAELRAATARIEMLNRISATLASSMELKQIVPAFAAELAQIMPFDRLVCGFVNESGDYIEIEAHPADTSWGLGDVIPVVGSAPGQVVLENRPVVQGDLLHSHRFIEDMRLLEEGLRCYVLVPLNARGRTIGVLALGSRNGGAYDEETAARLQPVADAVALGFENVRLFQRTRELSITDEVTPLYNFRFIHQIMDRELKLVDRYKSLLSLIFVDLDHFKPINDQHGHLRGSRVLREVGFLLRSAVRETDYPARYGGDEFVVILPQTDREEALKVAAKLRELIEGHTFLQEEGINATLGVSLGVATYPDEARSKEDLIRLADERMYGDKDDRKAGR